MTNRSVRRSRQAAWLRYSRRLADSNRCYRLETALAEERCNGCGLPRKQWGPVCSGMTQGDWTHYHSQEWWRHRYRPRPDYDPRIDWPERYTDGPI